MKIATLCFLHPHKSPGGQQRVAYDLFRQAASKYGAENSLFIAADFQAAPLRTAQSSRLTEVARGEFVYVCPRFEYHFFTNFDITGQKELMRLLESFDPDVVHFHHFLGFGLDFVPLMRARLARARLVFTFHEFIAICHNNGHLRRQYDGGICEEVHSVRCQQCFPAERLDYFEHRKVFFADMFSKFDALSTVSDFARQTLERNLHVTRPITVISNGPIQSQRPAVASPAGRRGGSGRCMVGFIGQVHETKGVEQLLDAMAELVDEGTVASSRVEVQIFGNAVNEPYREKLADRIKKINEGSLKAQLRGVYSPTDLEKVFSQIDVVVIPSMWPESYCLTADEAVMARKIVVCANVPAIRERIKPSRSTFFFESGSMKDLKRALVEALLAVEEGEWENPFTVPTTTTQALYEAYERQLYQVA